MKENVIIGKLIPAGTGCDGDRPQNDIVAAKAKELRDKRIARMAEVHDEEFDKIVSANANDAPETIEQEDVIQEDSILGDTDSIDTDSIDIISE